MWNLQQWEEATDHEVQSILDYAGHDSGSVDVFKIARKAGYDIVIDRSQDSRGRLKRFGNRNTIFLKPDLRPERIQWAASHEIGEIIAHRIFDRIGASPADCEPGLREQIANLVAPRLLLPTKTFFSDAESSEECLNKLKEIYSTASYELIAVRLLDRPAPGCVTVIDQGRITRRQTVSTSSPNDLIGPEKRCWEKAHEQCEYQEHHEDNLSIRCWPIHEPHWKREIVLTRPTEADWN